MAMALIADCEAAHDEYRELYWILNEYQLCGVPWSDPEYRAVSRRMKDLVLFLGYTPAA